MSDHRGFYCHSMALHFMMFVLCILFCVAISGPCSMKGVQNSVEYDACGSYKENFNPGYEDAFSGDARPGIISNNSLSQQSLENVCTNSHLFCFPSTLPGFLREQGKSEPSLLKGSEILSDATLSVVSTQAKNNLSWLPNFSNFKLSNGKVVSCSLNFQEGIDDMPCRKSKTCNEDYVTSCRGTLLIQKSPGSENSMKIRSGISVDFTAIHVEISPPLLDWGQKYLYFPSLAFFTVTNTHGDSVLNVYEPYSTSSQFYPCNFTEMILGPGEVGSVCIVFLPTFLGLSSGQLILQTSLGGFLIQARGFAIESPYGIRPILGLDISSSGRWRKNVSLFNPFDETLYVKEVTAWMSFSSGNTSHLTEAVCSTNKFEGSAEFRVPSVQNWLGKESSLDDTPEMAMRPHRNWEVDPHSTETIIEFDFHLSQGKIFGAFCLQLLRSSIDKYVVVVPLEAEVGRTSTNIDFSSPVSVSFEAIVPCDDNGNIRVALLLRNSAPNLLKFVKISAIGESTKSFQLKYMEGLLLFPGTATQVAVITYKDTDSQSHDPPSQVPNMSMNCKLLILTNDSSSPQIEIPCSDIVNICARHQFDSYIGYKHDPEEFDYDNARTGSVDSSIQSQSKIKAFEMAEADELVLGSWRSQGSASGMSVLDSEEVLFPMVEIGTHHPEWITVKNPSHQPVAMQLILNSGEIVDECRDPTGLLQSSLSSSLVRSEDTTPTRYGFSIAEGALTEAYVPPYGKASFGPIIFHPSSRCWWKSSALIRNNLSGVEWLSLRGFGGSLSLVLFEGADPVQKIEFKLNLPRSFNISPYVHKNSNACTKLYSKELYAKNMGDLPLEVSKIEISGVQCGLDGFIVHTCKGFALEPGESKKLIISHQTDFSAAMVQRDLELALPTGILVIPMKANLPMSMLNLCRRSVIWMRMKKSCVPVILSVSVIFLLFYRILLRGMSFRSQDDFFRTRKCSVSTTNHHGKSACLHHNQKNGGKFSMLAKMNGFLRSIGKKTLMSESVAICPDVQAVALEQGKVAKPVNSDSDYRNQKNCLSDSQKERTLPSSLLSKSVASESFALQAASKPGNLIVKVGKDKGKRRRKKKGSGAGLSGQFEVSSSQSGNSTPSSPLSPVSSLALKKPWPLSPDVDQRLEARNPFAQVADRRFEKPSGTETVSSTNMVEPVGSVNIVSASFLSPTLDKPSTLGRIAKPALLPSATFPSTGHSAPNLMCPSPFLASTSTIAPHARAPGSKLGVRRTVEAENKIGNKDEFKYDIWGDHLFGLHLTVRELATKNKSDSSFVKGPQNPVKNSQLKLVASEQKG